MNDCGIYSITNFKNGKRYIGQSRTLSKRKKDHWSALRRGKSHSIYLQRSWNEFDFKFEVMEYCNEDELSNREIYYINNLNSANRNFGYNLTGVTKKSFKLSSETIAKMTIKRKIKAATEKIAHTFISPKGQLVRYLGFREFCEINKLNCGAMWAVLRGKKLSHRGWSIPNQRNQVYRKSLAMRNITNGEILKFNSRVECMKSGLMSKSCIHKLLNRRRKSVKNWEILS